MALPAAHSLVEMEQCLTARPLVAEMAGNRADEAQQADGRLGDVGVVAGVLVGHVTVGLDGAVQRHLQVGDLPGRIGDVLAKR